MPIVKPIRVTIRGKKMWQVSTPRQITGGRRRRHFFGSLEDARDKAAELEQAKRDLSEGFHRLSREDQAKVLRCLDRLGGNIASLEEAIDHFLSNKPTIREVKTMSQVAQECLAAKEASGKRRKYLLSLKSSIEKFTDNYPDKPIVEIKPTDIEAWLNGNGWQPATRQGYLKNLRTLFSFSIKRGYCSNNPAIAVERPTLDDKPPGILTVDECERLLRACEACDRGLIPFISINLFAGLRPVEAGQLTWAEIGENFIEVKSHKAKTRRRRLVSISEPLRAWLSLRGDLPPVNLRKRIDKVKSRAGIPWPHDCLRHSFASYHLAAFQSADKTAHEMGHGSTQMLFQHYRELVKPEDAMRFWALRPTVNNS